MSNVTLKHSPILTNTDDVFLQEIKKKILATKYLYLLQFTYRITISMFSWNATPNSRGKTKCRFSTILKSYPYFYFKNSNDKF